jgi:hypothetical protein
VVAASVVAATSPAGLQPASEKAVIMDAPNTTVTNHNKDFFILTLPFQLIYLYSKF